MGLAWNSPDQRWSFEMITTVTAAKKQGDIDQTTGARFGTDSWTSVDLMAGWQATRGLTVRAGLFNLFDRTYWRWLDVSNLDANDPMIPLLSQPGRTGSFSISYEF